MGYCLTKEIISEINSEIAQVGVAEFAAISERTEYEFMSDLFNKLESGKLLEILTISAQCDLCNWISERNLLDGDSFVVEFNLSLNKKRNLVLRCLCNINMLGDDPLFDVQKTISGFEDFNPEDLAEYPKYSLYFCDMDPKLP